MGSLWPDPNGHAVNIYSGTFVVKGGEVITCFHSLAKSFFSSNPTTVGNVEVRINGHVVESRKEGTNINIAYGVLEYYPGAA